MFYACLSILVLLLVILCCVCLSIIDLETYNFGLYIVLLCIVGMPLPIIFLPSILSFPSQISSIVPFCLPHDPLHNSGTMLACALCVANPNACPNPVWYSNFCLMLQVDPVPSSSPFPLHIPSLL